MALLREAHELSLDAGRLEKEEEWTRARETHEAAAHAYTEALRNASDPNVRSGVNKLLARFPTTAAFLPLL